MKVVGIVWSPRHIERALEAYERTYALMGIDVCFIVGVDEHTGCAMANRVVQETDADVYLIGYDDQVIDERMVEHVLEMREAVPVGDVVSGWQVLGQNVPWASCVWPEWGTRPLAKDPACFHYAETMRDPAAYDGEVLLESMYYAALTAVPRETFLQAPIRANSFIVPERLAFLYPSRDGRYPYDKGQQSDWVHALDIIAAGHRIWVDRTAEVEHLAPYHNVPVHKFYIAEDEPGTYWGTRPRWEGSPLEYTWPDAVVRANTG